MEQKICIASGLPSVIPDFSGKGIKPKIALRFYGLFLFGGFLQASLTNPPNKKSPSTAGGCCWA
jgi:hypothetical protein